VIATSTHRIQIRMRYPRLSGLGSTGLLPQAGQGISPSVLNSLQQPTQYVRVSFGFLPLRVLLASCFSDIPSAVIVK
jgi:hypothetical protein